MTTTPESDLPIDQLLAQQFGGFERPQLTLVPEFETPAPPAVLDPLVLKSWQTRCGDDERLHQLQRLTLPGRRHVMIHTEPLGDQTNDLVIVNMPGWTETVKGEIIAKTHAGLSHTLPAATIDTHATYGIDGTLTRYRPQEIGKHTIDYAAQKTFDVFERLYEGQRAVVVATSMSAAVLARMAEINQDAGRPLDFAEPILYEPCLVLPENAGLSLLGRFAVHLACNTVDEIIKHSSPREAIQLINDTLHSRPPISDLPVIVGLGYSLLQGTAARQLEALAKLNPYIIQGFDDCLRNSALEQDPRVTARILPNRGHCMSMNSSKRVADIAAAVRAMGLYPER